MQLVEIIRGKQPGTALAKAIDYVAISKTPIVVNICAASSLRGCSTYMGEGMRMLARAHPALIENAASLTGMPVRPLALNDEIALDLI